jgi:uncharacterized protein YkwD
LRVIPVVLACALMLMAMALPIAARAADPAREAIDQLNQIRHARGLAALHRSGSLTHSAKRYATRMLRRHYFGHLAHIQVANGFTHAAETIAMHAGWSAAPLGTVRQWMASPPHRALLLSSRFHWVGMGLARGRMGSSAVTTWVAHLGAP